VLIATTVPTSLSACIVWTGNFLGTVAFDCGPLLVFIPIFLSHIQVFAIAVIVCAVSNKMTDAVGMANMMQLLALIPLVFFNLASKLPPGVVYAMGFVPCSGITFWTASVLFTSLSQEPWTWNTFFTSAIMPSDPDFDVVGLTELPSPGTLFLWAFPQTLFWVLFAYWVDQTWPYADLGVPRNKLFCLEGSCEKTFDDCQNDNQVPFLPGDEDAPALQINKLTKEFTLVKPSENPFGSSKKEIHKAVDGLSLEIRKGEIFALLGHNGAGKTTLVNCITGLTGITDGSAKILGFSCQDNMDQCRWNLSVCPQDNPMYPDLSVNEHLILFAGLRGVMSPETQIATVLEQLGMSEKRHAKCSNLSGGQKRRLWVATSLLGDAPVVFLDEPTSGMDPSSRRELWQLLLDMRDRGRTIVFTTHYLEEADLLADRKAVMVKGQIKASGTSRELKHEFGLGYHLRVLLNKSAPAQNVERIKGLVAKHVATATDELVAAEERTQATDAPQTLAFTLPFAALDDFGPLLSALEAEAAALGILDMEVAMTSLEEVFMKLGKDAEKADAEENAHAGVEVDEHADIEQDVVTYTKTPLKGMADEIKLMLTLRRSELTGKNLQFNVIAPIVIIAYGLLSSTGFGASCNFCDSDDQDDYQNYTTVHDDGDDDYCSGCNIMSGSSGTWGIGIAMTLPVVRFAVMLMRERVNKAKHVMIAQGLSPTSYMCGSLLFTVMQVTGAPTHHYHSPLDVHH